jgi:hypothetical protein
MGIAKTPAERKQSLDILSQSVTVLHSLTVDSQAIDPPTELACVITGEDLLNRLWEALFEASGLETGEEGVIVIDAAGIRVIKAPTDTRVLKSGPPAGIDFKAG